MNKPLIDLSVLIIFFNRPTTLQRVFDRIKEVKPSRLFLYQDGAREDRPDDIENIKNCREIVENIDWECEVHTFYQEKNVGVDPSGYIADTWAFSQTDKCLVLEDDVIPSISYFSFVKEMLDKYEKDERVMLISGMNLQDHTRVESDYFFSRTTITMAWASWSRVVKRWDSSYSFLKDEQQALKVKNYIKKYGLVKNMLDVMKAHLYSGKEHFETILIANQFLNEGLTIVPSKNMCVNIGAVPDASHSASDLKFAPRAYRRIFKMNTYEIDCSKIKYPQEIVDYPKYKKTVYYVHGWNHPFLRAFRFVSICIKKVFHGKFKEVAFDIKSKIKK